jgi:CRISPR/Cas system-associated exonuclease Cas4 (RecB family)
MGYCEFKIPFLIEGVKVKTVQMTIGSEHHEDLERIEHATMIPVPLTPENLENKKADLSFMREDVNTVFMHEFDFPSGKARVTLFGRADKIFREDEVLIVSDDKHTANPSRYDSMTGPYNDQLLQVLTYLHSRYDLGSSFGSLAEIPHAKKMYRINIIDSRTRSIYKTYEDHITKTHTELLFDYISRFTQKCLQLDELVHHNSKAKCKACGYFGECSNALK